MEKFGIATARPVSVTNCGLPNALSVTARVALRAVSSTLGVKVTEIVQVAPGTIDEEQVLVWAKSAAWVPVMLMDEMVTVLLLVFRRVTFWGALEVPTTVCVPKSKLSGESLIRGAGLAVLSKTPTWPTSLQAKSGQ
jgi:hypothetical protein